MEGLDVHVIALVEREEADRFGGTDEAVAVPGRHAAPVRGEAEEVLTSAIPAHLGVSSDRTPPGRRLRANGTEPLLQEIHPRQ